MNNHDDLPPELIEMAEKVKKYLKEKKGNDMIRALINDFKPAPQDAYLMDFQFEGDTRYQHLLELKELLEDDGGYEDDVLALSDFLDGDEINDRLLTKLCEKTDSHPVHNRD